MKVLLVGATGLLGTPICAEAAVRGHEVTAMCRHPENVAAAANVIAVRGDVFNTEALAGLASGQDAVLYAYSPRRDYTDNRSEPHAKATRSVILATKEAGVKRLLAVGGAGVLEVSPGVRLVETPATPAVNRESGLSTTAAFLMLEAETELDWTFLCPAGTLLDRGRTNQFTIGTHQIKPPGPDGKRGISPEDYAIAFVDELEKPRHTRQMFSVGY